MDLNHQAVPRQEDVVHVGQAETIMFNAPRPQRAGPGEADDAMAIQQFLWPGFRRCTATVTPVIEVPVQKK